MLRHFSTSADPMIANETAKIANETAKADKLRAQDPFTQQKAPSLLSKALGLAQFLGDWRGLPQDIAE